MLQRILLLLAIVLAFSAAAVWIAGSLLTAPAHQAVGKIPAGLEGREVQFRSDSGSTIQGWLIPGLPGKGAVILMHGVRSNRLSMVDRARFLSHAGYSVLLFDFQAHGESTGSHITFGALESKDAAAALDFMQTTVPGEKIGIIGVSMGGAASLLASPPLNATAIVVEMVYPTIDEAVGNRLTMRLGKWARVLAPLLLLQLKPRLGLNPSELRPLDHVAQLKIPKLFIGGALDQHTTLGESQRLYETASAPKEFWVVPGAAHVDLHRHARVEYEQHILEFFGKYLR